MTAKPFPVENSTTSFWRAGKLHEIDDYRSPEFPSEADIVIIGAGYAGTSLAYHVLDKASKTDRKPSIVIFEARHACSGATGRNGGHLKPDAFVKAGNVVKTHGLEAAEEVASFETRHLKAIADVVRRENIECDFTLTRALDVSLYDKAKDEMKAKLDALIEAGLPVDDVFYSSEETAEASSGIKGARGCFSSTTGHVWPYRLVTSLLAKVVANGVNLQTHTPVSAVSDKPDAAGRWTVSTDRGSISAKKIVFASNGYTSAILPELQDKIVPVRGMCSRIVCPSSRPPLLTNSYVLRFNDWEYDYLIPRTDGSIIVGGARRDFYHQLDSWFDVHDDSKLTESAKHYFDGYMQRNFHGWEDSGAQTDRVWSGIMGYTIDGYPYIGERPDKPGQYVCAGFNGHGMVQVFLSAKAIAEMVVEEKPIEDTDLPRLYRLTEERLASKQQHISLAAYDAFRQQSASKL